VPDDTGYRLFFHPFEPPFRSQRFSHISNAIALPCQLWFSQESLTRSKK
jgi:hypothetical protein